MSARAIISDTQIKEECPEPLPYPPERNNPPPFVPRTVPRQPHPSDIKPEDKSVAKLLEKVRQLEKERDDARAQLLEINAKYTDSTRMEATSRQTLEMAGRRIAQLEHAESAKVTEWMNKYKMEQAKNQASESRAAIMEEVAERLRKEMDDVKMQLQMERNTKAGNEQTSKAVMKSNMEMASQISALRREKADVEEDLRRMETIAMSYEQSAAEERGRTAQMEACAKQFEKAVANQKAINDNRVASLNEVIKNLDMERANAEAVAAQITVQHEKLQADHKEMRKINGYLATTEAGKVHQDLKKARDRVKYLEKKINSGSGRPDPRVEAKKRKSAET